MTLTTFPLCRLLKCRQICPSLFVTSSQPLVVVRRSKPDTVNLLVSFCSIKHPRQENVSGRPLFFYFSLSVSSSTDEILSLSTLGFFFSSFLCLSAPVDILLIYCCCFGFAAAVLLDSGSVIGPVLWF